MNLESLKKTKLEEVKETIEHIHYQHRYDSGDNTGTITEQEALRKYNQLLRMLPDIPELTDENKTYLAEVINKRIKEVPEVEQDKKLELEDYEAAKRSAFEKAQLRFNLLNPFERMKYIHNNKSPMNIDLKEISVVELDMLYIK